MYEKTLEEFAGMPLSEIRNMQLKLKKGDLIKSPFSREVYEIKSIESDEGRDKLNDKLYINYGEDFYFRENALLENKCKSGIGQIL